MRLMDKTTQLFTKPALKMMKIVNIKTQFYTLSTINFGIYGDCKNIDDISAIEIKCGHTKDDRDDLNCLDLE